MVAAYPGNPSHPGALTRCKPSCTNQQCGPATHSRTMTIMTVTDHIQRCPGTTICAKGIGSFIALLWSLRPFCLTHADTLWWDRMHYGETECLKQRCVHQQVSDSSGWLMLMHFIFKFNCHDGVESGKEPTWPPARVGEPAYPLKQL